MKTEVTEQVESERKNEEEEKAEIAKSNHMEIDSPRNIIKAEEIRENGPSAQEEKKEFLDDEDVDGEGYEFIIHEDLNNIAALILQQAQPVDAEAEEQVQASQFRFSNATKGKASKSALDQEAYSAMRFFGVNTLNYHSFCSQITRKHTPFEIDLTDDEINSDRPWRRHGASLDDFFNYGFNEHSWKEYAARQIAIKLKQIKGISEEEIAASLQGNQESVYERS